MRKITQIFLRCLILPILPSLSLTKCLLTRLQAFSSPNNEAIGYVLCKLIERPENPFTFAMRSLLVEHISVRPAARGKGVGTALIKQAEMLAKRLAVQRIQLDSWDFNTDAHAFFERLGFQKFNFRFWRPV